MRIHITGLVSLLPLLVSVASATVIDSFNSGNAITVTDNNGVADTVISADASIFSGERMLYVRNAHSGHFGPSSATTDPTAGTITFWNTGSANDQRLEYGITSFYFGYALNLSLSASDSLYFTLDQLSNMGDVYASITLFSNGNSASYSNFSLSTGTTTVPLSSFSNLSSLVLSDIDGISFQFSGRSDSLTNGMVVSEVGYTASAVPEPASFAALAGLAVLGLASSRRRRA